MKSIGHDPIRDVIHRRTGEVLLACALLALGVPDARAQASCASWQPGLSATQLPSRPVNVFTTWNDGTGPALYAGGEFVYAGKTLANRVARWDGREWRALGSGVDGSVWAMTTFDDGSGEALYVGGQFTFAGGKAVFNIAKWDGVEWSAVGGGVDRQVVAIAGWDDGSGPALYVGGRFTHAGGAPIAGFARFDGASWSAVGSGIGGGLSMVSALQAHDDGTGAALYVGGNFHEAGGVPARHLARWDGSAWSPLANGLNAPVFCLTEWNDGDGLALYAGGLFSESTIPDTAIVRWDGSSFTFLGGGLRGTVHDLHVFDAGDGSRLYAAGDFNRFADFPFMNVASWDGVSWSPLGTGTNWGCRALGSFDDGTGPRLYVGGYFSIAGGFEAHNLSSWDGAAWRPLRVGGFDAPVRALEGFENGVESALFAGGEFTAVDDRAVAHVARWNEREWSPLGPGLDGAVNALRMFDDGTGPALYAAGEFTAAGSTPVNHVARWDGTLWTAVGAGLPATVLALAVFDDGAGPALYASGDFDAGDGMRGVARWDGTRWRAVAGGIDGEVRAIATFDRGGRSVLVAGGRFGVAGGVVAANVAAFDGTAWAALSFGTDGPVNALAVFDVPAGGPRLFAGGAFSFADGITAPNIAVFDGAQWSGTGANIFRRVTSLATYDDGSGPSLFIGGEFLMEEPIRAPRIVKWNGSEYFALGRGLTGAPLALETFRDSQGVSLYAGGDFTEAGDLVSKGIARYANPCASALAGTVDLASGGPRNVLFVNDSFGGTERRLELTTFEPLTISVVEPPASAGGAPFALYFWTGELDPAGRRTLPLGLGTTCLPTPLSGGSSRLRAVWNNTGRAALGSPTLPSTPAPSVVLHRSAGTGRPVTFVLQGIIADPNSIAERRASVTNGIVVRAR